MVLTWAQRPPCHQRAHCRCYGSHGCRGAECAYERRLDAASSLPGQVRERDQRCYGFGEQRQGWEWRQEFRQHAEQRVRFIDGSIKVAGYSSMFNGGQ